MDLDFGNGFEEREIMQLIFPIKFSFNIQYTIQNITVLNFINNLTILTISPEIGIYSS